MVRWEAGTRERLQVAALELYVSHGFEATTVAEIAERVGVTERTFFRHFADKREVLSGSHQLLHQAFLDAVRSAPKDAAPLAIVASTIAAAASFFPDERRSWSRQRQTVVAANPALQERELLKLAGLAAAVADVLRERGVAEPAATLAAETGLTVFSVAFAQWIAEGETRSLVDVERAVFSELGLLAGGFAPAE